MFKRLFVDHPRSVEESYLEHMGVSASFGSAMLLGALACFVHAVVPGVCTRTGSSIVDTLHTRMVTQRNRKAAVAVDQGQANA